MKKYILTAMLAVVFAILFSLPSIASSDKILLSEDFSSYADNEAVIPTVSALSGTDTRVITDSDKKVLYSRTDGNRVILTSNIQSTLSSKTVMSVSLKHSGKITRGKLFSAVYDNMKIDFLTVYEDGTLRTSNGKIIGGIPRGHYRTITIRADWSKGTYDVYVDRKCIISGWKLPSGCPRNSPSAIEWMINSDADEESAIYIDSIRVYEGETLPWKKSFPHQTVNTNVLDFTPAPPSESEVKVIKNHGFDTGVIDVANAQNGAKFELYEDKDGTKYMKMYADEKKISGTSYFDVTDTALLSLTDYVVEIRFKLADIYENGYLRFFDTLSSVSSTWRTGYKVSSSGAITSISDNKYLGTALIGEWTTFSVVYDLVEFKATVYINGKKAGTHAVTNNYFPDMFRIEIGNSEGSVNETLVDRVRIYSGNKVAKDN